MPITLQSPELNQKLRSLATETGTSPEALAEETLTRYFAAFAELESMVKDRAERGSVEKLQRVLSKVSNAPADAVDQL